MQKEGTFKAAQADADTKAFYLAKSGSAKLLHAAKCLTNLDISTSLSLRPSPGES